MDSLCPSRYQKITGKNRLDAAKRGMQAAIQAGLHVKVNCVCLPDTVHEATELAALAKQYPITVRFIELMPIGQGRYTHASDLARVRQCIYDAYGRKHGKILSDRSAGLPRVPPRFAHNAIAFV
jgi:cyclic pyranopterin phosphate synthase